MNEAKVLDFLLWMFSHANIRVVTMSAMIGSLGLICGPHLFNAQIETSTWGCPIGENLAIKNTCNCRIYTNAKEKKAQQI